MLSENESEMVETYSSKSPLKSTSGRSSPALSHSPSPISKGPPLGVEGVESNTVSNTNNNMDTDETSTETNNRSSSSDDLTETGNDTPLPLAAPAPAAPEAQAEGTATTISSTSNGNTAEEHTPVVQATFVESSSESSATRNVTGGGSRSRSSSNVAHGAPLTASSTDHRGRSTSITNIISSTAFSRSSSGSKINGLSRSNTASSKNGSQSTPRRTSFGNLLSSFANSIRNSSQAPPTSADSDSHSNRVNSLSLLSNSAMNNNVEVVPPPSQGLLSSGNNGINHINNDHLFMSNSPTIANLSTYSATAAAAAATTTGTSTVTTTTSTDGVNRIDEEASVSPIDGTDPDTTRTNIDLVPSSNSNSTSGHHVSEGTLELPVATDTSREQQDDKELTDKDGFFSVRLTPLIDHSSSSTGLYFAPVIRKIKASQEIPIGRYTEKNRAAAHAPQGSSAPIVFKSKVVSRSHALFQCNQDGQWFVKDCKSSSGTFLNHVRLSSASQELQLMPLIDGDIIQLGMDYRGGTEDLYRCVKIRCEFNRSWQRNVNNFNLEIHKKLQSLQITIEGEEDPKNNDEWNECAICLLKLEPCQALFISPCSHSWHYKCIRPIIIKSYPQFYCPNCRSMCDLETDIEDEEEEN